MPTAMEKATYDVDLNLRIDLAAGGSNEDTAELARSAFGLGTFATQNANSVTITGGTITGITDLAVASGGTGSSTAAGARSNLGIQQSNLELAALAGLSSTNILVRSGSASYILRTVAETTGEMVVTNPGGILGDITVALGSNVLLLGSTQTITGDKTFSGAFKVDTISERTAANGVSIDGIKFKDSFAEFSEISIPATPAADKYVVFGVEDSGKTVLQGINEDGTVDDFVYDNDKIIASIFFRQNGMLAIRPDAPTITAEGSFTAISSLAGGGNTLAFGIDSIGVYRECRSVAISTSFPFMLYPSSSADQVNEFNALPRLCGAFQIDSIPNMRFFFGLQSATGSVGCSTFLSSDNPNSSYVGLQFSNNRGDTAWQFVCGNSSANQTVVSSGVSVVANTFYQFALTVVTTTLVRLVLYDQTGTELGSTSLTTNLPAADTNLAFLFGYRPVSGNITVTCRHRHFAAAHNRFGLNNIP